MTTQKGMLILVDMDGVQADFTQGVLDLMAEHYPEIPRLPYDAHTEFEVQHNYPEGVRNKIRRLCEQPGFFKNLKPVAGAIEGMRWLVAQRHDVRICTSPLKQWQQCVGEKYAWVAEHLGEEFVRSMIITRDKSLVSGAILIDDHPEAASKGSKQPEWMHWLYDQPYNRHVQGHRVTWEGIMRDGMFPVIDMQK